MDLNAMSEPEKEMCGVICSTVVCINQESYKDSPQVNLLLFRSSKLLLILSGGHCYFEISMCHGPDYLRCVSSFTLHTIPGELFNIFSLFQKGLDRSVTYGHQWIISESGDIVGAGIHHDTWHWCQYTVYMGHHHLAQNNFLGSHFSMSGLFSTWLSFL